MRPYHYQKGTRRHSPVTVRVTHRPGTRPHTGSAPLDSAPHAVSPGARALDMPISHGLRKGSPRIPHPRLRLRFPFARVRCRSLRITFFSPAQNPVVCNRHTQSRPRTTRLLIPPPPRSLLRVRPRQRRLSLPPPFTLSLRLIEPRLGRGMSLAARRGL